MKIDETEITEYIKKHYIEKHPEICITKRIMDGILPIVTDGVAKASDDIPMDAALKSIDSFLEKSNVLEFIRKRQPNMNPIPTNVINTLKTYFDKYLQSYELCHVYRKSNYKEDNDLYCVTAKNIDQKYACWSSWNSKTESLNQGHYNLDSEVDGVRILLDLYSDVTDETDKYGMTVSDYEVPQNKTEDKPVTNNIIEYQRHNRRL